MPPPSASSSTTPTPRSLITDREFSKTVKDALAARQGEAAGDRLSTIRSIPQTGEQLGSVEYEDFLNGGDPDFAWTMPDDEWDAIALNYTSGTTGDPKGVVYHHRGAYLLAIGNVLTCGMGKHPVYLWTLPMFHCNGWCFPWTLSVVAGTHVCLRQVRAAAIYDAIAVHKVTHLCGAPDRDVDAAQRAGRSEKKPLPHAVEFCDRGGAAAGGGAGGDESGGLQRHACLRPDRESMARPPSTTGIAIGMHSRRPSRRRRRRARACATMCSKRSTCSIPTPCGRCRATAQSIGEVMFRGNVVMKGYLKNKQASAKAFAGGWFHSGDLGVMHPDGYMQLKDRSKDIIISGGENISSIEVEDALYKHPAVAAAAVVAKPDEKWGETPCAFVELKPGAKATSDELVAWCRQNLAAYKCPRYVVFAELPKTSTGKIQKFKLREMAKDV